MIFQKLMNGLMAQKHAERKADLNRSLIREEAKIGGKLFGPIPKGGRREFFCLDKYTWVWYEEWLDKDGVRRSKTTRYDFRPDTVLKSQNGQYKPITSEEAKRLKAAIKLYGEKIYEEFYSKFPR